MKILFVCLGNICRSPLAEGIMLSLKEEMGLNWTIDSAGTAGYHIGEPPDHRTIANALKHGVRLSELRARQFHPGDLEEFDHVLVMDRNNLKNVLAVTPAHHREKVKLFRHAAFDEINEEIPDPYYGGPEGFETVFQLLHKGCKALASRLT